MTDAVTVYRWDDVGAPSLESRKPSDIMKVVKACLVDGYGAKSPLGWSVVEDEIASAAPYLSLRNNMAQGGSGGVFTMGAANDNTATYTRLHSHQEYTDKTTFAKSSYYYDVRELSKTTSAWMIIGTAKAFWFIKARYGHQNYWNRQDDYSWIMFAGDMYSFIPNDPSTFVQVGKKGNGANDTYHTEMPYLLTSTAPLEVLLTYPINNENTQLTSSLISPIGNGSFSLSNEYAAAAPTVNMLADLLIINGHHSMQYVNSANDVNRPRLRGRLPGVKISGVSGWRNEAFPVIKTIHDQTYFQMPDGYDKVSCVWIALEQWQ